MIHFLKKEYIYGIITCRIEKIGELEGNECFEGEITAKARET